MLTCYFWNILYFNKTHTTCVCNKSPLIIICLVLKSCYMARYLALTSLIIVFNINNNQVLKLDISSVSSLTLKTKNIRAWEITGQIPLMSHVKAYRQTYMSWSCVFKHKIYILSCSCYEEFLRRLYCYVFLPEMTHTHVSMLPKNKENIHVNAIKTSWHQKNYIRTR